MGVRPLRYVDSARIRALPLNVCGGVIEYKSPMEPVGEEDWEFLVMIVLDTHVLVWWVNGDGGLSSGTKAAIEKERKDENGIILISSISAWEIAMLVQKGRLTLATNVDDWLSTVQEIDVVRFVPSITMLPFSRRDSPTNFIPIPLTG